MSWKNADNLQIRFKVYVEGTEQIIFITKPLRDLLHDDDGGLYGIEQVYADAGQQIHGDHTNTEGFTVEDTEVEE